MREASGLLINKAGRAAYVSWVSRGVPTFVTSLKWQCQTPPSIPAVYSNTIAPYDCLANPYGAMLDSRSKLRLLGKFEATLAQICVANCATMTQKAMLPSPPVTTRRRSFAAESIS